MVSGGVFCSLGLIVLALAISGEVDLVMASKSKCAFPAIYNFGDSNSDTGGWSAAFGPTPPTFGQTYFGRPAGRFSDGRLIIDFLAENLGLPYLSAYLDSLGTNFSKGANFAIVGSSIRQGRISPFTLASQVSQFIQFKARTSELYKNFSKCGTLPNPDEFSKALYTIDIGHNDLVFGFQDTTEDKVIEAIPDILNQFVLAIQDLHKEGARAFLIYNIGPIGCAPFGAVMFPPKNNVTLDKNRCSVSQNAVVQEYNKKLKDRIVQLRGQLPLASITYVDIFTVKYSLIDTARSQGFVDPWNFCCGMLNPPVFCGTSIVINGTAYSGRPCVDPWEHISYDGVHYSEAASHWFSQKIVNGSASDPPVPISRACP